jgi:beta-lactamase class A
MSAMPEVLKPLLAWARHRARWIAAGAVLVAAAWVGGWMAEDYAPSAKEVQLTAARVGLPVPRAPEAPPQLQDELAGLVEAYGEDVGVAVTDVKSGWTADVSTEVPYPQQSVSKLWVAMAVLKAVDEGRMDVDGLVTLTDADRSVFFQPVVYKIGRTGYTTQISALLRRAIIESDNAANDKLMREVGGPDSVALAMDEMGLTGVTVGAYERDLQAQTAGLPWRPEYGYDWNFQHARERLPREVRRSALEAYLDNPPDGATPASITQALARLKRGELLSQASTARLLGLMSEVRTGPRRLKGGLPPGWSIGHKTGTGQDFMGSSVGINDVGLLTAPDGRTYAVAVMMRRTRHGVPARLAFMQSVTRAVAAHWARENAEPLTPDIGVAAVRPTLPEKRDGL